MREVLSKSLLILFILFIMFGAILNILFWKINVNNGHKLIGIVLTEQNLDVSAWRVCKWFQINGAMEKKTKKSAIVIVNHATQQPVLARVIRYNLRTDPGRPMFGICSSNAF